MTSDICDLGALDLSAKVAAGAVSSVEVVTAFLDRIEAVNPALNAIISLRPREAVLADAKRADQTPARGWLHGLPLAVKDLAETAGIKTTFGSPLFANHIPARDALIVGRMKAAGGIVIGKTNTPEFGLGSHTFNPVHGTTLNPYDLTRTPGGSSGGAAAALAARLLPVADGSDMMGSLRNPAAFCNVYGFRPTWGLVPADPVGEVYLQQLATCGPMGRSPADVAALLATMSGPDHRNPFALALKGDIQQTIRGEAKIRGKKIGWLGDWGGAYGCEPGIIPLCEQALTVFEDLGAVVERVDPPFEAEQLWDSWVRLRAWFNTSRMMPAYQNPENRKLMKPALLWEIGQGKDLTADDIHKASVIRSAWFRAAAALFQTYDALVLPSAQVWPFPAEWVYPERINGKAMDTYHRWMEVVVPVGLIGLPCLAVPAGFGSGSASGPESTSGSASGKTNLPMGFQMFGKPGSDLDLLAMGQAYHQTVDRTLQHKPFD